MRKRKSLVFIILIALLFLIAGSIVVIVNNQKRKQEEIRTNINHSLADTLCAPGELIEGEETPAFIIRLESMSSYQVLSLVQNDTYIVATLKVTAPDLYGVVEELEETSKAVSRDEALSLVDSALQDAPMVENEVELIFKMIDGQYEPVLTSEFLDAYYGGALRLQQELWTDQVEEGEE